MGAARDVPQGKKENNALFSLSILTVEVLPRQTQDKFHAMNTPKNGW
jgi:hypothetical protein